MRKDLILVAVVVATLTLMVVPLSQVVIDVLLAVNISLSVLLLMVALYLRNPSDFSTFPSVILLGTAFRLALSIGTTRLILSEADAGQIIETFGQFVVAGSIAIGLVIFLIITVVQFLVVTKGAERVAEVGARFALDAMPGKQMSIDAELRAGNLEPEEATAQRARLDRHSQFFGAMDGAMKFVKGDAIAGLIIILINLLGGIAVGMTRHGFSFGEAISVFSLLTVGDGLVAQIPALLMALCAGVIVTRVANVDNEDLGTDIAKELVTDPRVPSIAAFVVLAIGLIPGFPFGAFAVVAIILILATFALRATVQKGRETDERREANESAEKPASQSGLIARPAVSTRIRVVIGSESAGQLDVEDLDHRIALKIEKLYKVRGVRFPNVGQEVADRHGPQAIVIEIDEVPVFKSTIPSGHSVVRGDSDLVETVRARIGGEPQLIHWTDLKGVWVPEQDLAALDGLGYEIVPTEGAVAHLAFRIYERNVGTLFSSEIFSQLLDMMRETDPRSMREIEDKIELPALHRLLRYLVEDGVPVRPMSLVIEALHYWLHSLETPKVLQLVECLRGSLKRQMCYEIAGQDVPLGVMLLDPKLEAAIRQSLQLNRHVAGLPEEGLTLSPEVNDAILHQMNEVVLQQSNGTRIPAIVCASDLRRRLRNYLAAHNIHVPVLATHELGAEITTYPLGLLKAPRMAAETVERTKVESAGLGSGRSSRQRPVQQH